MYFLSRKFNPQNHFSVSFQNNRLKITVILCLLFKIISASVLENYHGLLNSPYAIWLVKNLSRDSIVPLACSSEFQSSNIAHFLLHMQECTHTSTQLSTCRGQRKTRMVSSHWVRRNTCMVFPSTVGALETKLRSSSLVAFAFTQ